MPWTKRGLLIEPRGQSPWVGTHAALPVIADMPGGHRVYFSSRDTGNRSHIGYATLDLSSPERPFQWSSLPVLSPGPLGAFDDAGVTTSCVVVHEGRQYLYYTGWSLGVSVPFYLYAGLAMSDDDGESFQRVSRGPLLDRNDVDPYLTASPWVIVDNGRWRMWYVSGTEWNDGPSGVRHRYHVRYAESANGVDWQRDGVVCLDYASPTEYAFGRPCVVKDADRYRMWYSVRGERYRMGYAESVDGVTWTRQDDVNVVQPSAEGWDSEMVTYPVVHGPIGRRVMLYNGNDYGRSGIGLATFSA